MLRLLSWPVCQKVTFWIYVYGANLSEVLELFFFKAGKKENLLCFFTWSEYLFGKYSSSCLLLQQCKLLQGSKGKNKPKQHLQTIKSCHYIITSQSDETQAPPELQARWTKSHWWCLFPWSRVVGDFSRRALIPFSFFLLPGHRGRDHKGVLPCLVPASSEVHQTHFGDAELKKGLDGLHCSCSWPPTQVQWLH